MIEPARLRTTPIRVDIGLTGSGRGRSPAYMSLSLPWRRGDGRPVGDVGLQRAMGIHYTGSGKLDAAEMESVAAAWRPWRSVATWYLWRSLDPSAVKY